LISKINTATVQHADRKTPSLMDAFSERYSAQTIAEFSSDAAYSFVRFLDHTVYAVGSLFDRVIQGEVESVLPNIFASALAPHCHASRAVLFETEATILMAYESGEGSTPAYKVAQNGGYWASCVEEAAHTLCGSPDGSRTAAGFLPALCGETK
jgi:hypothetical protein